MLVRLTRRFEKYEESRTKGLLQFAPQTILLDVSKPMRAKVKGFAGVVRVAWAAMKAIASGRYCHVVFYDSDHGFEHVQYLGPRGREFTAEHHARLEENTTHE